MNARLEFYLSDGRSQREELAREAWLVERAATGSCCLLAYSLRQPAVILGFGQPADDVNLEWCRTKAMPVLRRITGGTGVIHHQDLLSAVWTKSTDKN